MSAVTIEALREEFEAAREAQAQCYERLNASSVWLNHAAKSFFEGLPAAIRSWCPDEAIETTVHWFKEKDDIAEKVIQSARCYIIARDYGLEAAMLYKLSDGACDPRKGAQS